MDFVHIDNGFGCGLHGIGVEVHVGSEGNFANFLHRLQDARFIVGHHDGNQPSSRAKSAAYVVGIDQSMSIHREVSHAASQLFQTVAGVQDRVVLHLRGDDVITLGGGSKERKVIGFRTATGENNFASSRTEQPGDRVACPIHRGSRLLPIAMD